MWYAIAVAIGFVAGIFAYHFFAAKVMAEVDAVHAKLDKVLSVLKG